MPRSTVPSALVVREVTQAHVGAIVYRIVKSNDRESEEFDLSFRSSYEQDKPPRRIEQRLTVIHMGISTYADLDKARGTAHLFPKIGPWIATLRLMPEHGFCLGQTGPPGHWTVWGRPGQLKLAVADIVSV